MAYISKYESKLNLHMYIMMLPGYSYGVGISNY